MSRSGYVEETDNWWQYIMWRGCVASAIKGRRGQAFLKEMLRALDALPERKLIAHELAANGAVCALGAVGKARGIDMAGVDPDETEKLAGMFGIADAMAREIVFENDEYTNETPEARYSRMRKWIEGQIR